MPGLCRRVAPAAVIEATSSARPSGEGLPSRRHSTLAARSTRWRITSSSCRYCRCAHAQAACKNRNHKNKDCPGCIAHIVVCTALAV